MYLGWEIPVAQTERTSANSSYDDSNSSYSSDLSSSLTPSSRVLSNDAYSASDSSNSSDSADGFQSPGPPPPPPFPPPLQEVEEKLLRQTWRDDASFDMFKCPITLDVMTDPVVSADGFTYERWAIDEWLRTSEKSPVTGLDLTCNLLFTNHVIRTTLHLLIERATRKLEELPLTACGVTRAAFNGCNYGASYLSFDKGDAVIQLQHAEAGDGWAFGVHLARDVDESRGGWFPEAFLERLPRHGAASASF